MQILFLLFVDIYTVIVNASIKRGWGWDPINWFNTATFCPFPGQYVSGFEIRGGCFVDIGDIVNHHCLEFQLEIMFSHGQKCYKVSVTTEFINYYYVHMLIKYSFMKPV